MNSRSSSRLSYRNVLIAAGLAAALGGQNPEGSLDGSAVAASRLTGHEGAMSPAASPMATSPTVTPPTATPPTATSSPGAGVALPRGSWR